MCHVQILWMFPQTQHSVRYYTHMLVGVKKAKLKGGYSITTPPAIAVRSISMLFKIQVVYNMCLQ